MTSKADARSAARAKAAAAREAAARTARRRRRLWIVAAISIVVVIGAVVLAVVQRTAGAAAVAGAASSPAASSDGGAAYASATEGRTSAPPWSRPTDTASAVRSAGLSLLSAEGEALHIHQHLSITVDGKPVTVPAGLGIVSETQLSSLHTHDTSGILHVESPTVRPFFLDEAFAEWDVRLADGAVGPYVNGRDRVKVAVFVDQRRFAGDPRTIRLAGHQDIDFVITTDGAAPKAPAAFRWPSGY